jgi:hypothetical protein
MKATLAKLGLAAVMGVMLAGPVCAEDRDALGAMLDASAVSEDTLGRANGREYVAVNSAELNSVHGFNQANGAKSGSATIAEGALSNFRGAAAVVVNSGHNAVVQVSQQVIFNLY